MEDDGYGKADIHIHTSVGDGMADIPRLLDFVQQQTNLDVIAITDHDEIEGSYQAREQIERDNYRFNVVMGMEITTLNGHLLALFIERPVPSLQPLTQTIEAVHAQGGLCIVPHPMSWLTRSIGQSALERVMSDPNERAHFDGIEMINPTIAGRVAYQKAKQLNERRYKLAETGGSDAHFLASIGSAYTLFQGKTAAELHQSLLDKTTRAGKGSPIMLDHIGYDQVLYQQFRGLVVLPAKIVSKSVRKLWRLAFEDRPRLPL